jgi:hypothetical protein
VNVLDPVEAASIPAALPLGRLVPDWNGREVERVQWW